MATSKTSGTPGTVNFDMSKYLRSVGGNIGFGIVDPRKTYWGRVGQALSGQLPAKVLNKYEQYQVANPSMKTSDVFKNVNATIEAERAQKSEQAKIRGTSAQAYRAQQLSGMNYDQRNAYLQDLERQRLNMPQQFEETQGWSLQDTLAFEGKSGKKYQSVMQRMGLMSPAQIATKEEEINSKMTAASVTLFRMAELIERAKFTGASYNLPDGTPIYNGQAFINGHIKTVDRRDFGPVNTNTPEGQAAENAWLAYQNTTPTAVEVSNYGQFRGYMYQYFQGWIDSLQDPIVVRDMLANPVSFSVFNEIVPLSFEAQTPAINPETSNAGRTWIKNQPTTNVWLATGTLHDGDMLDSTTGRSISLDIPDNIQLKVVVNQNSSGQDVISFNEVSLDEEGNATETQINPEQYRIRDFAVPQTLTKSEASYYFPALVTEINDGDTVTIQQASDGNLAITHIASENGWKVNFGVTESGEWDVVGYTSPEGWDYTLGEFTMYTTQQNTMATALTQSDLTEFNSSTIGTLHLDMLASPDKYIGISYGTGENEGKANVRVGLPLNFNLPNEATNITAPDQNGVSYFQILSTGPDTYPNTKAGDVVAEYAIPASIWGDTLPGFVTKEGGQYYIDISSTEGFATLLRYYPESFWNILQNTPVNNSIRSWLQTPESDGGMAWSDQQVKDFYGSVAEIKEGQQLAGMQNAWWWNSWDSSVAPSAMPTTVHSSIFDYIRSCGEFLFEIVPQAAAQDVGFIASKIMDPYGRNPVESQEFSDFFSIATTGAIQATAAPVLAAYQLSSDALYTIFTLAKIDDPTFRSQLTEGFKSYGIGYLLNGEFQATVRDYSGISDSLLRAADDAALAMSFIGPAFIKPRMPMAFRSVRTGPMSFVKSIGSFEDLRLAASYNGYKVTKQPMTSGAHAGQWRLGVNHRYIYFKNFKEADYYFKTGNTMGDNTFMDMLPSTKSESLKIDDNTTLNIPLPKESGDILIHIMKNHPGRLGGGFVAWAETKGFKLSNGRLGSALKSDRLASIDELMNLSKQAIEEGMVSLDQVFRSSNQVKLWIESQGDALAGHIISQLNRTYGYINKMITIKDGVVVKGIKETLPGAPEVNSKVSYAWGDVFEYHKFYVFEHQNMHNWIEAAYKVIDQLEVIGTRYGISFDRKLYVDMLDVAHYFPRGHVLEKIGTRMHLTRGGNNPNLFSTKLKEQKPRAWELHQEGLDAGYRYDTPQNTLASYISHVYRAIANEESMWFLDAAGITRKALDDLDLGIYTKAAKEVSSAVAKAKVETLRVVNRIKNNRGLPNGYDMAAIRRDNPEFAARLQAVVDQIKRYGLKERRTTKFIHFSDKANIEMLDPKYSMQGPVRSAELARKEAYPQHWVDRINVYTKQTPKEPRVYELPHKYAGEITGQLIDVDSALYRKIYNDARIELEKNASYTIEGIPGKITRNITQEEIVTLTEKLAKERGYTGIEYQDGTILFHSTRTHDAAIKPGKWDITKSQFTNKKTSPLFNEPWTVITSFKSDRTLEWNYNKLRELEEAIAKEGYTTSMRTLGKYGDTGVEAGFLVPGMPYEMSLGLCRRFKQESVMTDRGLLYNDGILQPADLQKTKFGTAETITNNYTELAINGKNVRFSVPLFEDRFPFDLPIGQTLKGKIVDLFEEAKVDAVDAVGIAREQKAQRASAVEANQYVGFTEATGNRIGLYGRVFDDIKVNGRTITGKEIEEHLRKTFESRPNLLLRGLSDLSRNLVMTQTIDIGSAAFIQGIPILGYDVAANLKALFGKGQPSFAWAQAVKDMIAIELNPKVQDAFRYRYRDYYNRAITDGLITSEAGTEFIQRNTFLEQIASKVPIVGTLPLKLMDVANRGFAFYGESGRVRIGMNIEKEWIRRGGTGPELQEMLNNLTGVTSSKSIGVGQLQRTYESIGMFAPRFFRANLMAFNRALPIQTKWGGAKRGVPGRVLVETYAGMMAGWTAIYVALCGIVPGNWPPKLKPWPKSIDLWGMGNGDGSDAFTLEIGGQNIGMLGGFPFSMLKMWGSVIAMAAEEPRKLYSIDVSSLSAMDQSLMENNPIYRMLTGKASPTMSLVREMVTGRDYLGNRLDKGDYLQDAWGQFIPMVLQSVVTQDPPANAAALAAGFFGLRNYPETMWDQFYNTADEILSQVPDDLLSPDQILQRGAGTLQWQDLNKWQKATFLNEHPELQDAYDAAVEAENKRRDVREVQWDTERTNYETQRDTADNADFAILRAGGNEEITSTRDLRSHLSDNSRDFRTLMENLRTRYADLYTSFEEAFKEGKETAPEFDLFYNEYYDIMYNEAYTLPGGTPNYTAIDSAIAELQQKYSAHPEFFEMMQDIQRIGYAGQDTLKLKLWQDKQTIEPYFNLPETGHAREDFLKDPANQEIEAALVFWGYVTTMQNPDTEDIVKSWCLEYNVPESMVPALAKLVIPAAVMQQFGITDPNLTREFSTLPTTGYARERFLIAHPEYLSYYTTSEEQGGLGHPSKNAQGEDIYDPDKIPSETEENQMNQYFAIPSTNQVLRQSWRCRNQAGEMALVKYGHLSKTIYGSPQCEVILNGGGNVANFFSEQAQ